MEPSQGAGQVVRALLQTGAYRATKYLDARMVVKATRRHKLDRRNKSTEFVVTLGRPNYLEREFLKDCKRAGVELPIRKVQLKFLKRKSGRVAEGAGLENQ